MPEPLAWFGGEPIFHLRDASDEHRPLLYETRRAAELAAPGEVKPAHRTLVLLGQIDWGGSRWWTIYLPYRDGIRRFYRSNHQAWFATESLEEAQARWDRERAHPNARRASD